MKKILLIIAAIFACTLSTLAHDFEVDGIYYNLLGGDSVVVTYQGSSSYSYDNEYSGDVTIPATVMYNSTTYRVTSIRSEAFYDCYGLTSITIPEGVTRIYDRAFSGCSGLTSIVIPNSIMSIGSYAFDDCYNLQYNVYDNAKFVGNIENPHLVLIEAMNTNITSYSVSNNTKIIYHNAFSACSQLEEIVLPPSLRCISKGAFYDTNLKRITFPSPSCVVESAWNPTSIEGLTLIGDTINLKGWFNPNAFQQPATIEYDLSSSFILPEDALRHFFSSSNDKPIIYDIDNDGKMEGLSVNASVFFNSLGFKTLSLSGKMSNGCDFSFPFDYNKDGKTDWLTSKSTGDTYSGYNYNVYILTQTSDALEANHFCTTKAGNSSFGDINADGRVDILVGDNIFMQQIDGSFIPSIMTYLDPEDVDSMIYNEGTNSGGFVAQSYADALKTDIFARGVQADKSTYTLMDLDKNGHMDYVNYTNGNVLFNFGGNAFRKANLGGKVLDIKDLNGDAIPDLLLYDETTQTTSFLYYEKGELKKKVLQTNLVATNGWCYDFDKDGDADILLAFDWRTKAQYAFLVFYKNQGINANGETVFRTMENSFAEDLTFLECKDVDNDGYYEVLASKWDRNEYRQTYELIRCSSAFKATIDTDALSPFATDYATTCFGNYNYDDDKRTAVPKIAIGDFDGDSKIEYIFGTEEPNTVDCMFEFSNTMNSAPQQMDAPSVQYDGYNRKINITWGEGVDAESSSVDLSYALCIGTAPGKGDLLYAHAKADGQRLILRDGNMGHEHQYSFDISGLAVGDSIYIAVQAVDPNYRGGKWSNETVYCQKSINADFSIDRNQLTTVDTLLISLPSVKQDIYTYNWDFGADAIVVKDTLNYIYLLYPSIGNRDIVLHVTDTAGNVAEMTKTVSVTGCKLEYLKMNYPNMLFDFDQDGFIDGISSGFLENNGDGTFVKVGKLYNLNLSTSGNANVVDYNKDGLPDVFVETNKGNMFVNAEDKMFDIETISYETYNAKDFYLGDFNNDGEPDGCYHAGVIANHGNMQFDALTNRKPFGDITGLYIVDNSGFIVDINNDGYLDVVASQRIWPDLYNLIIINHGNWNFTVHYLDVPELQFGTSQVVRNCQYGDVNNDGYIDFLTHPTTRTVKIYYGDADLSYQRQETIYLPTRYEGNKIVALYDFDNNGWLDILTYMPGNNSTGLSPKNFILWNDGTTFEAELMSREYNMGTIVADYNNDGAPDLGNFLSRTCITNEAPQAPTNLRMYQTAEGVVLEWDAARDKETPSVQMRYNIGVKKAGATGEGAYIVSPMNGGKDEAAIIPSYPYLRSTRYVMPFSAFEVGQQYEFTVQAIDGWDETKTSEPCTFTVLEGGGILVSSHEVCIGEEVTLTYSGTEVGTPVWDAGTGILETSENGQTTIKWHTSGVQMVAATVNGKRYEATVYVTPGDETSLEFTLPPMVLGGAPINFTLPEAFADASNEIWIDGDAIIQRRGKTLDAVAYFPEQDGTYQITIHYMTKGACAQEVTYTVETQVVGNNITPIISIVGIDAGSGKTVVNWEVPENVFTRTDLFDKIWVQKEQGRTNNFVTVAELPLTATKYIDMASDPTLRKARYRIVLSTQYGGESKPSEVHSNVHVMLNQGLHNSVNIIWTPYEGAVIDQYTILRGLSPDNLTELTTASGYESSYTDKDIVEGETYYYALSYSNTYETEWITIASGKRNKPSRIHSNTATGTSNVVASEESVATVFPTSLTIRSLETEQKLTDGQDVLHLYPEILPANATIKRVVWSITQGSDLAMINENGELSYIGNGENGTVTVEARTIDGSELKAILQVTAEYAAKTVAVEQISLSPDNIQMTVGGSEILIQATILPADATNQNITWHSTDTNIATVKTSDGMSNYISGLNEGTAMIIATTEDGNFSDTCIVTVQTATIPVTGISIIPSDTTLYVGETHQLIAEIAPMNATNQDVRWTSDKPYVVSVSAEGFISAKETGTAIISCQAVDGDYIAYATITVIERPIVVESLSLNVSNLDLLVGDTYTLIASVYPENAPMPNLVWSSSDVSVATIESGVVTALAAGQTLLTVATENNSLQATCWLTVSANTIAVTGVILSETSLSLTIGDVRTLVATITPTDATNQNITWISSDASIVSVSEGTITALAAGVTDITVITEDGGYMASCQVTVNNPQSEDIAVTGISLDVPELQLFVGTTHQLTATIMPDNATNKNITWSTLYADVATVEDGLVTAIAKGTTMITATTEDGGYTASCMVTVSDDTALENVDATNASGVYKVLENGVIYIIRNGEKYTIDGRKVE